MPAWDGEALFLENPAHVDEVIADNAEPHPSFHSRGSFVAAAVQTVPPLEYADSPFTTSPPLLSLAEPASLLVSSALGALGGVIGNGDSLHAHVLDLGFPLRGVEASIAGDQFRCAVVLKLCWRPFAGWVRVCLWRGEWNRAPAVAP